LAGTRTARSAWSAPAAWCFPADRSGGSPFTKEGSFWTNNSLPLLIFRPNRTGASSPQQLYSSGVLFRGAHSIRVNREIVACCNSMTAGQTVSPGAGPFFEGSAPASVCPDAQTAGGCPAGERSAAPLVVRWLARRHDDPGRAFLEVRVGQSGALEMFGARDAAQFTALGRGCIPERQPTAGPRRTRPEAIETALREGSLFFEWTHRRLDGSDFPTTVLITRMETAGQVFLEATVRDVTAQKQLRRASRRPSCGSGHQQASAIDAGPGPLEDNSGRSPTPSSASSTPISAYMADPARRPVRPGLHTCRGARRAARLPAP